MGLARQGLAESAEEDNAHSIFKTFTMPPPTEKRPVPWSGVVDVPPHECLEQKQGFGFHTLLSKREIIGCLVKVRTECNKALGLQLYNTHFTKSIGVEEFEQTQAATLLQTISYLKETWSAALKNGVKVRRGSVLGGRARARGEGTCKGGGGRGGGVAGRGGGGGGAA